MKRILQAILIVSLFVAPWVGYYAPAAPQEPTSRGSVNMDARVRAALALADVRQRRPKPKPPAPPAPAPVPNCGCNGPDCRCAPDKCECDTNGRCTIDCTCGKKKALTLNTAIDRAVNLRMPLCIWVAEVCLPCEKKMPHYLHVHVEQYERTNGVIVAEPCVIVGKSDGQGGLVTAGTVPGCPDDIADRVRELLNPRPVMYMPPPPPMFFAGFGGSCSS